MSDNVHYVNLMPYKLLNGLKVVSCPYFARLLRKITTVGGVYRGGTTISLKISKSPIFNNLKRIISGKGYKVYSGLCKLNEVRYAM